MYSGDTITTISNHEASLTTLLFYDWKQTTAKRDSLVVENENLKQQTQKLSNINIIYDTLVRNCFSNLSATNEKFSVEKQKNVIIQQKKQSITNYLIISVSLNILLIAGILTIK